jgi:CheY-like chemotaxis protein
VKERASIIKDLRSAINRNEKESIAKNNFIAILAHELRNPLAPIRTTLEILMLQEHEAQTQRLLHSADRQAFAMQRLLDDLLDITRVTQGKFKLQLRNENVCEMLQRCMDTTSELMKLYDHTVVMSPKCDPTVFLHVDTVRFEQVIVNLLSNSAKYTPPSGRILISMDVHEESVAIKVTDNGIGIVEANIKEVFEPFWQLESETAPTRGGIGVGLSLTKHIVELHGGTIMAESEGLGKGSTFTVRMPRSEIDRNDAHSVLLQKTKNIPTLRILIADDNGAASDSLAKLLSLKGHVTRAVYSGNEVLTSIDTFIPDILLLDIGLPDMSGFEVAKRLREQGLTIKIVALSGYGQQEDKKRAAEAGFDDHFTKPMPIKRFEEYLSKL